jgi:hypothetical protein
MGLRRTGLVLAETAAFQSWLVKRFHAELFPLVGGYSCWWLHMHQLTLFRTGYPADGMAPAQPDATGAAIPFCLRARSLPESGCNLHALHWSALACSASMWSVTESGGHCAVKVVAPFSRQGRSGRHFLLTPDFALYDWMHNNSTPRDAHGYSRFLEPSIAR